MTVLAATEGRLVENIVYFARALRKAGVRIGTSQVQNAIQAVAAAGFTRRMDFYHALRATLICRPEDLQVFGQVFQMFWRDPEFLEKMVRSMLPLMQVAQPEKPKPKAAEKRAAQALWGQTRQAPPPREELDFDMRLSWSENDVLRHQDFEQMSAQEMSEAERMVRNLRLPVPPIATRRFRTAHAGRKPDVRAMLRQSARKGGEIGDMLHRAQRRRPPDLVAICDISGSMSTYSRIMMHFLHALTWARNSGWGKVHGFTFGTRLTNVSRALGRRDVDDALDALGQDAPDWRGGTRIGEALRSFNRGWSRRVLSRGAVVLLITDGLERGDAGVLKAETERLALSCRRLIWLNPLLRWENFEPRATGVRTLLPLVDSFHPCHSLSSLADVSDALSGSGFKARFMKLL